MMELNRYELNLIRQWFNAVQDLSPEYLEQKDDKLAEKIHLALGMTFRPTKRS